MAQYTPMQPDKTYTLTDKEYEVILNLYHEFYEAYSFLPDHIKLAFKARLFKRG